MKEACEKFSEWRKPENEIALSLSTVLELMAFHLKTRETPLFAAINTPEKQPEHLFRSLGFNHTWDEWRREEHARTRVSGKKHDRDCSR